MTHLNAATAKTRKIRGDLTKAVSSMDVMGSMYGSHLLVQMETHLMPISIVSNSTVRRRMLTHHGTCCLGERLWYEIRERLIQVESMTHYIACFQVKPSRLFTVAAMLRTREAKKKRFTATSRLLSTLSKEYCKVVVVTPEKVRCLREYFECKY